MKRQIQRRTHAFTWWWLGFYLRCKRQCRTHGKQRTRRRYRLHDLVVIVIVDLPARHGLRNGRPRHFEARRFHSDDDATGFVAMCERNLHAPRERRNAAIRINP
jgi:hypothetical protein